LDTDDFDVDFTEHILKKEIIFRSESKKELT